jgi:branched-chain amino acid transport system substrate-binding protein
MEAIYVVGFASLIGNVFSQLKEENFKGFILGGNAVAYPEVTILPEVEGVYIAAPIIYNPNFPFAKEIEKKYVNRYNKPFSHAAAGGYDVIKILAGLWKDEEISRERVKSLLEKGFVYSGVFGIVNVKPGEHDISFPLYSAQIIDGEVRYR